MSILIRLNFSLAFPDENFVPHIYCRTVYFQGLLLGFILYFILAVGLTKSQLIGIHLDTRCTVLIGCVRYVNGDLFYHVMIFYLFFGSGLYRAIMCIFNAFRARRFAQKHKLILQQAFNPNGGAFSYGKKNGIPSGCGFEFPGPSLLLIIVFLSLIYWMT